MLNPIVLEGAHVELRLVLEGAHLYPYSPWRVSFCTLIVPGGSHSVPLSTLVGTGNVGYFCQSIEDQVIKNVV